ncbi:hypothetical protein BDF14DRAFT_1847711 [Spinellus fusiger]|nr:hypothetical protein BDF14DRAFT_1847711 [Spinellus fusiger]
MVIHSDHSPTLIPTTNLVHHIFYSKFKTPEDKVLSVDALTKKTLTFGQIKENILRFAAGLQDVYHIHKGDIVAVYAPNQHDFIVPLLGTIAIGATIAAINPSYNANEASEMIMTVGAKVLITHKDNIDTALKVAQISGVPLKNVFIFGDVAVKNIQPYTKRLLVNRKAAIVDLEGDESKNTTAFICFSSGTSGKSKGVMSTHLNVASNIEQIYGASPNTYDANIDRAISMLPFFHIYGLIVTLIYPFFRGIPIYVMQRFQIELFCETVQREKITLSWLVPPIILLFVKDPLVDNYDLSSLRYVMSAAAPLSSGLVKEFSQRYKNAVIRQAYGLTETSTMVLLESFEQPAPGSVGKLIPNVIAKILNEEGKEVKQGEKGELCIKSPSVMKGYFENPEATAECMDKEGFFHTGDVALIDKNNNFYIVDRIKELIKVNGFQVAPAEIEGYLLVHPAISDCAVIGIYDHNIVTEIPRAYIVLKPGFHPSAVLEKDIMKHVADQVPSFKKIRSIKFIKEIPKSPTGKILRRILRDQSNKEHGILAKL